jgi:glycosyltransferase involved in cell wall biosynthesis
MRFKRIKKSLKKLINEVLKPAEITASVLVCVRNVEKYIADCINSILNQTYKDFEIVIIEEFDSNDKTRDIIKVFKDKRIRYFRNWKKLGISKSRNLSVKLSRGEYLFFTDGDCVVSKDWIKQGIMYLNDHNCVGVEGKSYHVSEEYVPTFSDHFYEIKSRDFMTNNMAYKRKIVEHVGGFDERYSFHEDRDLGLRIQRFGKIRFNPNMKVFIQQETMTPADLIKRSDSLRNRVFLFKRFGGLDCMFWRIVDPLSLAKLLFPPIFFISLVSQRFTKSEDLKLVPYRFVYLLCSRLKLWNESAKERVFLI